MTSYVLKKGGLPLASLFVTGLLFALLWGGKVGFAQNNKNDMGVPVPQVKPDLLALHEDGTPEEHKGDIVLKDAPVPETKPSSNELNGSENIILASIAPDDRSLVPPPRQKGFSFLRRNKNIFFTDKQHDQYREVFALERAGDFARSDKKIKKLKNDILVGHILAERYLRRNDYTSSYKELVDWLKLYSDHPQAREIYSLMVSKKPADALSSVEHPSTKSLLSGSLGTVSAEGRVYQSSKNRDAATQNKIQKLMYKIHSKAKKYEPTAALALLNDDPVAKLLDDVEYDQMRAIIAAGYLYASKQKEALNLAKASWKRSKEAVPLSGWVYGLSLWKEGKFDKAASAFESTAFSKYSSGWMVSAASYWAARAYGKDKNKPKEQELLEMSASYNHTFYGVIAAQALKKKKNYNWETPKFDKATNQELYRSFSGQRALALLELGKNNLAEKELLIFNGNPSREYKKALIALASEYKLPALQMRLASLYAKKDGDLYDFALYPWAPWEPQGGYRIDKALVHAFVRQESRFNVDAKNPSGATGLMQLMPATASYIAGHERFNTPEGLEQLKQPSVNLSLGQDYIVHLLKHKVVQGDLLSLALAYNAGPGTLSRWKAERSHIKDPLLFIETIPYAETRAFVERVLANYWIYKDKAGEKSQSLQAVVDGNWALFAGQILPKTTQVASR